jgi:3-deoxy-D-manno-octulosonic-acid transferase
LLEKYPDLLLVLVPRHPDRFSIVADMINKEGFAWVARTDEQPCDSDTRVFLGDTMGEVPLFYAASDVAFVGGSLVPIGGHNLLEPAALGLPLVSGPHVYNAQDISDMFIELGACHIVDDTAQLVAAVDELLANPEEAAAQGNRALGIVQQNRGALARLLGLLEPLIGEAGATDQA